MVRAETFIVAVDGSHMSYVALRLALSLMRAGDIVLVVHCVESGSETTAGKDGVTPISHDTMLRNAQVEALKYRLRPEQVRAETLRVHPGSVVQALVTVANRRPKMFFVGASGRGHEAKPGSKPLGSVAEQLLIHARVPVVFVRSARGGKFALRASNEVNLLEPRAPLTIGVAVDGSNIAKRAFDLAVGLATPLDTVLATHVHDTGGAYQRAEPSHQLKNLQPLYVAECAKALALRRAKDVRFVALPKKRDDTNHAKIADFCADAGVDLLVLGSIELADPSKGLYLGSVAAACAKATDTNVCIVKNFV
ncbi:hypothetical protein KFE25_012035 [Diacronema lutheri]|uniref:UspA domain-containing protein n=2 Tax=Diacronema lutheri TaxID=2081491 RepID=A0A8J6C3C9_DIALT|nr:hypothetical protein KFE25_001033 [Diacronema lutheri]KAG8462215.1 hypothetical protein KFE25_012035 [Diacronema lutheri]